MNWEDVRGEFYCDGSYRDIYVLDTTMEHWQSALDAIRQVYPTYVYQNDGEAVPLPALAQEAFPAPGWSDRVLLIDVGGPIAKCHFFFDGQIEFDLDPKQVLGQIELDGVLRFMRVLSEATGRDVLLTPESHPEVAIFRVRGNDAHVQYAPFGGYD